MYIWGVKDTFDNDFVFGLSNMFISFQHYAIVSCVWVDFFYKILEVLVTVKWGNN